MEDNKTKLSDFEFDEIIKRNVKKTTTNNQALKNFDLNEIVTKKQPNEKPIKVNKKQKGTSNYHYDNYNFKNLNDLSSFLLLEYYDKEKHAAKLLSDTKFLKWLEEKIADVDLYEDWVLNVLK